jgi:hypothetical protein
MKPVPQEKPRLAGGGSTLTLFYLSLLGITPASMTSSFADVNREAFKTDALTSRNVTEKGGPKGDLNAVTVTCYIQMLRKTAAFRTETGTTPSQKTAGYR